MKYPYVTTPYQHQRKALRLLLDNDAFALFMEMGTGKSKVVIDRIRAGVMYEELTRFLVVCPRAVMGVWMDEFHKHSDLVPVQLTGAKERRIKLLRRALQDHTRPTIIITNHEAVKILEAELRQAEFEIVVIDESTRIKTVSAQRTRAITALGKAIPRRYILTGMPVTKSPLDLYAQFRFLDPRILGFNTYYGFRNRYAIMGGYQGYEIIGYRNLEELQERVDQYSYRALREDCLDLPPKVYEIREVEMEKEQARVYKELRDDFVTLLESGEIIDAPTILARLTRLSQIAGGFTPEGKFLVNKKLQALEEVLDELGDAAIIIWCHYRNEISMVEKFLSSYKYSYVSVHGDLTSAELERRVSAFQKGEAQVLVGQPRTGGLGLNLTRASVAIYYSNSYSLEDRAQSEDRIYRIGQKKTCLYLDLVTSSTIDEHVLALLKEKKDVADALLDKVKLQELLTRSLRYG